MPTPCSPQASTPEADATEAALAALEAALVTAGELGEGWELQATAAPAETAESMCGTPVRIIAPDLLRTVRNLQAGHFFAGHGISVYADEATAAVEVDAVRQALASGCTELTTTFRNTTTNWTVAPTDFAAYGDESLAIGAQTQFQGVPDPSQGYFVLIRRGEHVAVVIDIGAVSVDRAVTEAFAAAAGGVRRYYQQRGQLPTERSLLDDNGDGIGRDAASPGEDGSVASRTYLDQPAAGAAPTDEVLLQLLQRRAALEAEVEELRIRRSFMQPDEYQKEFERLMIELARVSRAIRARS